MNYLPIKNSRRTLERFIDQRAEESVSESAKERVLSKTLEKIRAGDFDMLRRKDDKRIILRYIVSYLAEQTATGKIKIIVIVK